MMQLPIVCVTCALLSLLVTSRALSVGAGCQLEQLELMPKRTKKLCTKILALREVQRAMEGYLGDESEFLGDEMRGELGVSDNGAKRQDVDHVFLRFGRAWP
ncbi:myosuppressin-like isoform X1 [Amphibalanus amphitrite]|uniref:myosuppressin-like n=1 Tax=Amphibalanus amphitrite TaxID=1232801 RepID=UPI001C92273E|nr:myosuppressin-like [Amphibalanus amphitrite]XP_043246521.1 myosuppressin-like isoform X1 [Amphibalanus amphitrite]